MKNFKLLLATTVILSTGALIANADTSPVGTLSGETVPVQAKAEIIHARSLSATPLDFGKIVVPTSGEDLGKLTSVKIYEDGREEVLLGDAYILQKGHNGVVTGATCAELNWTDVLPQGSSGYYITMTTKPSGADHAMVQYVNCTTVEGKATFSGTFGVRSQESGTPVPAGEYSGSFTVTVIEGAYSVTTPDEGD